MNQPIRNVARHIALVAGAIIVLSSSAVFARTSSGASAEPNESELTSHRHYVNHDGQDVHSPAKTKGGNVPAGASAKCTDGTYSFSRHHAGTCSRHGGVEQWE
jgi:hypothetical protein